MTTKSASFLPPYSRSFASIRGLLIFAALVFLSGGLAAQDQVAELVRRADEKALHEDRYWQVLLHYQKGFTGWESEVDDALFFNAPDGKTNPRSELHATIAAFFQPLEKFTNQADHAVCRFPARLEWLKNEIGLDPSTLPAGTCTNYAWVYEKINPRSATVVFPAAFINGPASMFGHTLLVFDPKDHNRVLARAVNYAAYTGQTFGPFYTVMGLMGLFPGFYSIQPYYEKIEQYSDFGHRDIWEYELNFSKAEVDRMLLHAWELQNMASRYYFFTENCSYNILWIIAAGRPELRLAESFESWVIPIDTVKRIRQAGAIGKTSFRASPASKIQHLAARLPIDGSQLARAIAHGKAGPEIVAGSFSDKERQVMTLDLALEFMQYELVEKNVALESYRTNMFRALKARSAIPLSSDDVYEVPEPSHPEDGHDPTRFGLGGGVANGDGYALFRLRPVYHGHDDPDSGYTPGAQIQMGETEVRYTRETDHWELEKFSIVDVFSVAPRNFFFKPFSWKVRFGFQQYDLLERHNHLTGFINTGTGVAYDLPGLGLAYAMLDIEAMAGGDFVDHYAVGAGPSVGLIRSGGDRWKTVAKARGMYYASGESFPGYDVTLSQILLFGVWQNVSLDLKHAMHDDYFINEAALAWHVYF